MGDGQMKTFLNFLFEEKRKHIKHDPKTGLPLKYRAGLSDSTAKARKAHFNITSKMSDSDPKAYEPAPGDATAKTKESKYTKKYHKMYGEETILIDETADSGLAKKSKDSGISIGTLRKVYRRGVAAWNSGHRPGTTPQQWGMARVNSYITKGKTYHTADKDLHEMDDLNERSWSAKYKRSIDCSHPKGFSQRAHCASVKENRE